MTFRNDLDAAHARIESLERENRALADENARLRAPDRDDRAARREAAERYARWFSWAIIILMLVIAALINAASN